MTKHTPGPWRLSTRGNFGNLIEAESGKRGGLGAGFPDEGYRTVATYQACCASERYDEQEANMLANGFLIAAAPELLEALESVLDALGALGNRHELNNRLSSNECQQVWAAYDKARGQS